MRRNSDYFGEAELDLIYLARTLRDALRLERLLEDEDFDYLVETGTYSAGFLIRRNLTGAYFYVAPAESSRAKEMMERHHYKPYTGR